MSIVGQKHGGGKGFSSVPTLDFALLDGEKDRFLAELRHILVNVGFLYLANPPIDKVRVELEGACPGGLPDAHIVSLPALCNAHGFYRSL